jgi:hypothetical protein
LVISALFSFSIHTLRSTLLLSLWATSDIRSTYKDVLLIMLGGRQLDSAFDSCFATGFLTLVLVVIVLSFGTAIFFSGDFILAMIEVFIEACRREVAAVEGLTTGALVLCAV